MLRHPLFISIFKKTASYAIAFAFGSMSAAVAIECGMRILGYGAVSMLGYGRSHYNLDLPELGYAGRPNLHGIQTSEGVSEVNFNSHGFNDIEHSQTPKPNSFRVAVIGNSYSMAVHVARQDGFVWRLGRELTRCQSLRDRPVETINLAVNGYTIHQQYLILRDYGLRLSPDLVLLQVNDALLPGDIDPLNNLSPRIFSERSGRVSVDYAYLETSRFKVRASRFAALIQEVSDHSRLLQYALEYRRLRPTFAPDHAEPADRSADDQYRQGRDLVFDELVHLLRDRNIPLAAAIIPNADGSSYLPAQVDPLREEWRTLANSYSVPFFDFESEARELFLTTGRYLHGFGATAGGGHLNRFGHAFFARALSDRVCNFINERSARHETTTNEFKP
jgi:lysophospholipase L1-like esterase